MPVAGATGGGDSGSGGEGGFERPPDKVDKSFAAGASDKSFAAGLPQKAEAGGKKGKTLPRELRNLAMADRDWNYTFAGGGNMSSGPLGVPGGVPGAPMPGGMSAPGEVDPNGVPMPPGANDHLHVEVGEGGGGGGEDTAVAMTEQRLEPMVTESAAEEVSG